MFSSPLITEIRTKPESDNESQNITKTQPGAAELGRTGGLVRLVSPNNFDKYGRELRICAEN